MALRPTADKVKGALFNILASRFDLEATQLLDLFAGSGALGIEALSRGAAAVTFVEQSAASARVLRDNLQRCGFATQARVLQHAGATGAGTAGARADAVSTASSPTRRTGEGWSQRTLADLAAHALADNPAGGW